MTNFNDFFAPLYKKTQRSVATILTDYGQRRYLAQTEAGNKLVLTGQASVGDKVFFDANTKKILEQAPSIVFSDIPV
ncbi:MAG: hypothetical protein CSA10_01410 [Cardiobacteriales bacterium]|nr:MAG: hypothetical protein CSA10_01410 [Cardiobacteriales bacterium]